MPTVYWYIMYSICTGCGGVAVHYVSLAELPPVGHSFLCKVTNPQQGRPIAYSNHYFLLRVESFGSCLVFS